ncbi:MAG: beta-propeller fold lactonase family protein [Actinobacteria bacterium]|nr:beta-propeller fold lactonase family protein [Actinomycetota bacterium]
MLALGNSQHVRRLSVGALTLAAASLAAAAPADAARHRVHHKPVHRFAGPAGTVYTETNVSPINEVVVFDRAANGTLTPRQRVPTGGVGGLSPACMGPPGLPKCPIVDAQGEVALSGDGHNLFAVNAGSNTISSFVESSLGLVLVNRVASGGNLPISVTTWGNVLYVLNQLTGSITGFRFARNGVLAPIPGSTQSLSTPGPDGVAAQVSFDPTGRTLAVTQRGTNVIDTFVVSNGVAGPAIPHPSAAVSPFGFAFDGLSRLVVSDALSQKTGAVSSYSLAPGGGLTTITASLDTAGGAPCWVVITPDNRYAYISNTTTKTIARFAIAANGSLSFLGTTPILNTLPGPFQFPTDEALSRDGRYLYVLLPSVFGGPVSRIDAYRVGADGSLGLLGSTAADMPAAASGLAAR